MIDQYKTREQPLIIGGVLEHTVGIIRVGEESRILHEKDVFVKYSPGSSNDPDYTFED